MSLSPQPPQLESPIPSLPSPSPDSSGASSATSNSGFERVVEEIKAEAPAAAGERVEHPEFEVLPPEQPALHTPENLKATLKGVVGGAALLLALGGYGFDPEVVTEEQYNTLCSDRAARLANKWGAKLAEASEFWAKWEDEILYGIVAIGVVHTAGKAIQQSMQEQRAARLAEEKQRRQEQANQGNAEEDISQPGTQTGDSSESTESSDSPAPEKHSAQLRKFAPPAGWSSTTPKETSVRIPGRTE